MNISTNQAYQTDFLELVNYKVNKIQEFLEKIS